MNFVHFTVYNKKAESIAFKDEMPERL